MKFLFIGAFLLLLGTSNAQNFTTADVGDSTTAELGSGDDTTAGVVTPSKDPCLSNPCKNGGTCDSSTSEDFVCTCSPAFTGQFCEIEDPCVSDPCKNGGYCKSSSAVDYVCECLPGYAGEVCQTSECPEKTFFVNATSVQINSTCASNYTSENILVKLTVSSAGLNDTSSTTQTCENNCFGEGFNVMPVGTAYCDDSGEFQLVQLIDCGQNLDELEPEQQLTYAEVATSDPESASSQQVNYAVSAVSTFTSNATSIEPADADSVITITNNVLQASTEDPSTNRDDILDSVDQLAEKIDLSTTKRSISASYQEVQSHIAFAVAEGNSKIYFAATASVSSSSLIYAGPQLQDIEPTGSYISATPDSIGGRVSFRVYSTYTDLFPTLTDLAVKSTVLSAFGDSTKYNFTFQKIVNSTDLKCKRYNRVSALWADPGDCGISIAGSYVTCSCDTAGEYLIQKIVSPTDNTGLSGGAIAGIVIVSVAAVGLIGGAVYYFAFYKKKDKGSSASVSPYDEEEMKSKTNPAANLDDEDD